MQDGAVEHPQNAVEVITDQLDTRKNLPFSRLA
jgi:hypothetical protein